MGDWTKRYLGWDHFPACFDGIEVETYFTLSEAEKAAVMIHRRDVNRLGLAIQIGYLRMTGTTLHSVAMIPPTVLQFAAAQLGQTSPQLASIRALYRRRATLHDHQEAARTILGLRTPGEHVLRKLKAHLRKTVTTQVNPAELVNEARGWLDHNGYVQPGQRVLLDLARGVCREFREQLGERLALVLPDLPAERWTAELSADREGVSRLEWLRAGPRSKRPQGLADHLAKIRFLKAMGAEQLDLGLCEAVLRALAQPVLRRKAAVLGRGRGIDPLAIACFLRLRLLELNDVGIGLVDHRIADLWRQARDRVVARDGDAYRRLRRLPHELVLLSSDPDVDDRTFRETVRTLVAPFAGDATASASRVGAVRAELATQGNDLSALVDAISEIGVAADDNQALAQALAALERADAQNGLPAGLPCPFGATWRGLTGQPDRRAALDAFKAATLLAAKRSLRNGSAWCPTSLHHQAPKNRLISAALWQRDKRLLSRSLGLPDGPERALGLIRNQLDVGLKALAKAVREERVRIENGRLVVPRLQARTPDPEVETSRRLLFTRIGPVQIADLLVEADRQTQFSRALLGRAPHGEGELVLVYVALLALGTNLSAADMTRMVPGESADAVGDMIRRLELANRWRKANDAVVERLRALGVARHWGDGATSSADMMSLETSRRLWSARQDPRRRTPSVGTYTHVLDQWAIAHNQPILLNRRQAGAAIEGALHRLPLERLAVDTHGFTHFAMALAKLLGFDLCPRLADLADRKLYVPRGFAVPAELEAIARPTVSPRVINKGWDGLLHVAASVARNWCPATWALDRFGSAARGEAVYQAGGALGQLLRTLYLADYLANDEFRRTIHALLAQGEAVHRLQRAIHAGPIGAAHGKSLEELTAVSGALTLLANLVILWNASGIEDICLREPGRFPPEHLARIAPIAHAHINMRGILQFRLGDHRQALLDRPRARPSQAKNRPPG